MIRVLCCTLLVSCGTSSSREPPVPAPSRSVVVPSPAVVGDTPPEPAQEAARPQVTNAEPWAMPAGRIGRLRNVNGEMLAVFGAQDPRFVGRLSMRDNYGDNWIETTIVAAGEYRPPSHVLGVSLDPERSAFSLELGAAVEVHDIYADTVIGRPNRDELAARGFRVTKCGRGAPDSRTCNEGDLFVVGPVTKVPVPASPNAAASEAVRALYARARGGHAPDVRAVLLNRQLGLHWATEESDRAGGSLVWTAAPSERAAFTYRVLPRELWIAGDSFLVFSLDDPIREGVKRRIRIHQFRAGQEPIEYAID